MSITSQALKIGAMLLLTAGFSQLLPNPAQAQYSDYYSNKRAAEASRDRTLYYPGSSYGSAAAAYQNRRYGSGAAQYYNPNYGSGAATTNQARDCQILAQQYNSISDQGAKNIVAQVYQQQCSR